MKRDAAQAGLDGQDYERRCSQLQAQMLYYEDRHTQLSTELSNAKSIIGRLKLERNILLAQIGEILGPNYTGENVDASHMKHLLTPKPLPIQPQINGNHHTDSPISTHQPQQHQNGRPRKTKRTLPLTSTRKRKRDADEPKRPKNAYVLYSTEQRRLMDPNDSILQGKLTEFTKVMGPRWRALSGEERQKFVDAAEAEKARYKREMSEYHFRKLAGTVRKEEEDELEGDAHDGQQTQHPESRLETQDNHDNGEDDVDVDEEEEEEDDDLHV